MNTFEILIVVILGVYTLGSLYFAITGRIQNNRMKKQRENERKEDLERADKSLQWEEQLKVLTNRMGQLATENQRLADTNRQWQTAYSDIYRELQEYKKKYEPDPVVILDDAEEKNVNEQSPKGGHMTLDS
jgi:predicted nuclease with TOPRIM domain